MIDFEIPDKTKKLKETTEKFILEKVIPLEKDSRQDIHGPHDDLRTELNEEAKKVGLLSPSVGKEWGGLGLNMRDMSVIFEASGYSLLGPQAMNCSAPDEGNMHMLEVVANNEQKNTWLKPLAAAEIRSCFSMTEPSPGAGSDPTMLKTTATKTDNGWLINGEKWFITGFNGAKLNIIMARTAEKIEKGYGATIFLVDNENPAIEKIRTQNSMESSFPGGHCQIRFNNLEVPDTSVLGEVNLGYKYAQVRLAPARLTHCMRWLGAAKRAHEIASDYASKRTAFGKTIGEHGGLAFQLTDNQIDIHMSRLFIWHTAWLIDQGDEARNESSMSKVFCSEAAFRIVDRSMQTLGGMGITDDTMVERLFREIRPFRIYDGPSEVHRWAVAKRIMKAAKGKNIPI
tara:strand:+ start:2625 stop:3824 length:1200 start_codon:yes stop_codon:yes gene_type:complete